MENRSSLKNLETKHTIFIKEKKKKDPKWINLRAHPPGKDEEEL